MSRGGQLAEGTQVSSAQGLLSKLTDQCVTVDINLVYFCKNYN